VLVFRLLVTALVVYLFLLALAWLFQERLAFPAPRSPLPDPANIGLPDVRPLHLTMWDGTRITGWFLPPQTPAGPSGPALLWFYGNAETIGSIWPILRDFRPPMASLLVVDYPGYGASSGRASEAGLYAAAELAFATLRAQPEVDSRRVFVYGRSLGSAVAIHVAAHHDVAGLVLEAPFTSARDLSRRHYPFLPRFVVRVQLDNLRTIRRTNCPVLVVHGAADRLVPAAMGERVAKAAPGPSELVLIEGADHNDTYARGGRRYRDRLWDFIRRPPEDRTLPPVPDPPPAG
jgi:fermentation-respiration switch protein FrsA (DUF1100 family)